VVLTPTLDATLTRLAALQGRSKASIAREFLTEVEPVLSRVAGLLELAAKARQTGATWPKEFVADIERAQHELEAVALGTMGQLDAFSDRAAAVSGTSVVPGRRGRAVGASRPPGALRRAKGTPRA
jgi:hypothetical protein